MKLNEIMNTHPVTIEAGTDLTLARHTMAWADVRHLPVVDRDRKLKGVLSERDVLQHVSRERDLGVDADHPFPIVDAVMTTRVQTASADDAITEAAARLAESNIGCLPITEKGVLIGLVSRTDVLRGEVRQAMTSKESALLARDVMTPDPKTVLVDDYLLNAAGRMQNLGVRHLPVVNGTGEVVGMLSDRDVRAGIGDPTRAFDDELRVELNLLRVTDAMNRGVYAVTDTQSVSSVAALFVDRRLSAAPVLNADHKLVGIISYLDLLRPTASA